MLVEQYPVTATPAHLAQHYVNGLILQAPSTNSQPVYYGTEGNLILLLAPNTTLSLSNITETKDIWFKGTTNDKLNVIGM